MHSVLLLGITAALILPSIFIMISYNAAEQIKAISGELNVVVFLKDGASDEAIADLKNKSAHILDEKTALFISKDEAFKYVMSEDYFLVIDAGTGGGRCLIFDGLGKFSAMAYEEWIFTTPPEVAPLGKQFNPDEFWRLIYFEFKSLLSQSIIKYFLNLFCHLLHIVNIK